MKYWISLRKIASGAFTDNLGPVRYLAVPDGQPPAPGHEIPQMQWLRQIMALFQPDPKFPNDGPSGDILFFVHGYNSTVDNVDDRHRKIQAGLTANGFACPVISFDWPSGDLPLAYLPDRDKARAASVLLVSSGIKLFVRAQAEKCDINVHVLGHSTGAFLIREAFDHADDGQATATAWTAGQLVLIAGDVSAASFSADDPETESTYRHCYRLTNFFNGYDEVLQISNVKRVGLSPRVGRVGLPSDAPSKAVNVNCSDHFHATYPAADMATSHSWYFGDAKFLRDLTITLKGSVDWTLIPTRTTPSLTGTQSLVI
ncbi:alpha/beta hydrolase [Bradyrhizobium sp. BR13661]|jgi:esterase/lipase superfamily enzyme|uniref:alpha/beta hydrolase n=1 Tax=Bradyrhizobium sp. BR13661 TaxID=2940622 RepID=UPI002474A92B|nr:alpha/beta hydrolase [Bradyrhizobium sp. BR13661]MDH6260181.1 esterase/lipase superfamily enzyme [Bradyrhizobium sp. BR13661]